MPNNRLRELAESIKTSEWLLAMDEETLSNPNATPTERAWAEASRQNLLRSIADCKKYFEPDGLVKVPVDSDLIQ